VFTAVKKLWQSGYNLATLFPNFQVQIFYRDTVYIVLVLF